MMKINTQYAKNFVRNVGIKFPILFKDCISNVHPIADSSVANLIDCAGKAMMATIVCSNKEPAFIRIIAGIGAISPKGSPLQVGCYYITGNAWLINSNGRLKAIGRRYLPVMLAGAYVYIVEKKPKPVVLVP